MMQYNKHVANTCLSVLNDKDLGQEDYWHLTENELRQMIHHREFYGNINVTNACIRGFSIRRQKTIKVTYISYREYNKQNRYLTSR